MAFLAQRGLPDHLTLHILELAGAYSVSNVCATDTKNLELIHRIQCDFPPHWRREYHPRAPPSIASLEGVERVTIRGDIIYVGSKPGPRFSTGTPVHFPPSLRSLHIYGEPSAEVWAGLPHLEHLHTLRLEICGATVLRAGMLPPNLQVLFVHTCEDLLSIDSLPPELHYFSVCSSDDLLPSLVRHLHGLLSLPVDMSGWPCAYVLVTEVTGILPAGRRKGRGKGGAATQRRCEGTSNIEWRVPFRATTCTKPLANPRALPTILQLEGVRRLGALPASLPPNLSFLRLACMEAHNIALPPFPETLRTLELYFASILEVPQQLPSGLTVREFSSFASKRDRFLALLANSPLSLANMSVSVPMCLL